MNPEIFLDNRKPKKKFVCPDCGNKSLVLYVFADSFDYVSESSNVGKCDFLTCYHYPPKEFFANNKNYERPKISQQTAPKPATNKEIECFNSEYLEENLKSNESNNFMKILIDFFGISTAYNLKQKYKIGTWKNGNVVFWYVDFDGDIRSGKILQYDSKTRKKGSYIYWLHVVEFRNNGIEFNFDSCLFGEHLLNDVDLNKPVAIVESEKTAIIASVEFPAFIWLAAGSVYNLQKHCKALNSTKRKVFLFPDLPKLNPNPDQKEINPVTYWNEIACNNLDNFEVINITDLASEEEILKAYELTTSPDLADFIIVRKEPTPEIKEVLEPIQNVNSGFIEVLELEQTEIKPLQTTFKPTFKKIDVTDRNEIDFSELENFFSNIGDLPTSIKIQETTFLDLSFTIEQSLKFRTKQNFNQLTRIKAYLQNGKI